MVIKIEMERAFEEGIEILSRSVSLDGVVTW